MPSSDGPVQEFCRSELRATLHTDDVNRISQRPIFAEVSARLAEVIVPLLRKKLEIGIIKS